MGLHRVQCFNFNKSLVPAAALLLAGSLQAAPLPQLSIDPAQVAVSGLSSGGFMAVQLHIAYSSTFKRGAGVVAGGPFYCAQGSVLDATGRCMTHSTGIPVSSLADLTRDWAAKGWVDPVENLATSKVYMFSGTLDSAVRTAVMNDLLSYYKTFVPAQNIAYRKDVQAEHSFVTDDYGNDCSTKASPYISDCNFDLAGQILQQLHGPLNRRNDGTLSGTFIEFDQTAFVTGHAMANTGWAYVPQSCSRGTRCKLHVVLHGCLQNTATVGQQYVRNTGYNRWADTNNIVLIYPQTSILATNGCWDWWGYDSPDYAKKSGPQMKAIKAMVDRVSAGAPPASLPAPTGVSTSAATNSSMKISWSAVTGAEGYNVYRGGSRVNGSLVKGTEHVDTGLSPGTSYQWTVRSVDDKGGESEPSSVATGKTTGATASCTTASNYAHVAAGRAYQEFGLAYAKGSKQNLGLWSMFSNTTLKQTAPDYYVLGSCS
ncbi:extracellular catalytic domain type 2 short-chain-length polyhydroxyalkanoate depolymerase [Eleftheria terrae]|uniref:extracellular catalytic domain type 2 short-chain-length polyhydroxyalkanoate depolymerase n=1 Tax=Eleftheria terrae TaxID=1597781 RepID=UPI00263A567F|nr:PHB depolymerase family esterase [Eleftheria terrae]WKB54800.1 fibronectin type III domain-containing protein [Eleftheria terrae]